MNENDPLIDSTDICPTCEGKGYTEWGDEDDPDAWAWCADCGGEGVREPANG